ncbi:CD3073 family putative ECF transporter S component [Clostridium fallax]|uniref:Energy-coupling factor transport system substrate-specific component n=1 Tax=Clostridium fallax TaxID=1533 RepID=A0A1M4W693_9CLOT|nr:CD3073 family putative ECF transporter S component [Clostridium fallax]SHE76492.1 energy-coupling factor transport system substrate-specific component [Clostridium fallax]SQB22893.1 integral membrane protein [Clostridium fallax]
MGNNKLRMLTFSSIAIALNIVLGILCSSLRLPLYIDALGTVLVAVYFGPLYGMAVGALSNLITGIISNPKDIPFLLVNVAIGLIVGLIAKKYKFNVKVAIITGIILGVVCPLIGTPIGVWVYGGLTGTGLDFVFLWLKESGQNIFVSSFIPKLINNLMDKTLSCVMVAILIKCLPRAYKPFSYKKIEDFR